MDTMRSLSFAWMVLLLGLHSATVTAAAPGVANYRVGPGPEWAPNEWNPR